LTGAQTRVSVVVLAFGPEPILEECVLAIVHSHGVLVQVILVDNGCSNPVLEDLSRLAVVDCLRPGRNTGFAGGCNLGAAAASGEYFVFVNSDAVVAPNAVAALVRSLQDPQVGLASGSLRLYDRPDVMNSAGNPIHYLGLSWAGGLGEPATMHAQRKEVAGATGAALACTRNTWDSLAGFCEPMFAYSEDADLSLRCWQSGRTVVFVPDAVVLHRYEFSRNPDKMYLVERNRLLMVLTVYEARTLVLMLPALVGLEIASLVLAVSQKWGRKKFAGWWWLVTHSSLLVARRNEVQNVRRVPDVEIGKRLTSNFDPGEEIGLSAPPILLWASRSYWKVIQRLIR